MLCLSAVLLMAALSSCCSSKRIVLAEANQPKATIVLPPKAPAVVETAANALQEYIRKISGVTLPINKDGKKLAGTGLYIGNCEDAPKCELPKSGANWEAYMITEKDGSLYFNGLNPSPIAFAVYSFIEDDLGVRWFAPGELWEKVPKAKTPGSLSVCTSSRTVIPGTSPRIWSSHDFAPIWKEWNFRNKTVQSEVVSKRNFQNKLHFIFPVEKYAKEHPEYYPMMKDGKRFIPPKNFIYWRPCESNPEVQKIVVDYINDLFDKYPLLDSFSLGMDDVSNLCCCPNCRAMDDAPDSFENQRFSDRHYKFVNIIAKEVAKKHPDKFIGTLVYAIALQPPKTVDVMEPNVFGYITETCAYWWKDGQKKIDNDLTKEWSRRIKHLSRYDYYGFASLAPRYTPHFVDQQMKYDKKLGLEGMYIETYTFLPLTMPMIWQFAKLEWDASLNTDKLLDEFMTIYGDAKPQMARFWDLLEKSYMVDRPGRGHWEHRNIVNSALAISPEDIDKAFAILDEATNATSDPKVKERISIHRDALKLSEYAVKPYAINQKVKNIHVNTQADADKVLALAFELEKAKAGREEYVKNLTARDDLIGMNMRGLEGYMQTGAFSSLEANTLTGLFEALAWYAQNKPNELQSKYSNLSPNSETRKLVESYIRIYASGIKAENLISNGNFEITEGEKKENKEMVGWDNQGCPKGWHAWSRANDMLVSVVPGGRSGNAVKLTGTTSMGCIIQNVKANENGKYLLTGYFKSSGNVKPNIGIRFHTPEGKWHPTRANEMSIELEPHKDGSWAFFALPINVPKGAGFIVTMPGVSEQTDGSVVLFDDFQMYSM